MVDEAAETYIVRKMNYSQREPMTRFDGDRSELMRQLEDAFLRMQRLVISRHALSFDGELTRPQYLLLHVIRHAGPQSISELAGVLDIGKPGTSGMVARLEKAGLVTRERDEGDRRIIRVVLTPAGSVRVADLEARVRLDFEMALSALSDAEVLELVRLYNKLIEAAENAHRET